MKWFEIALVVLTLGSGLVVLLDKLVLARRRAEHAGLLDSEPVLVDYSRAFFPVLAVVLVLRSFVAEPLRFGRLFLAGDDISWTAGWAEGAVQTALNAAWGVVRHLGGSSAAENPGPGELLDEYGPISLD